MGSRNNTYFWKRQTIFGTEKFSVNTLLVSLTTIIVSGNYYFIQEEMENPTPEWGVLPKKLGGGVLLGYKNPYPVPDRPSMRSDS